MRLHPVSVIVLAAVLLAVAALALADERGLPPAPPAPREIVEPLPCEEGRCVQVPLPPRLVLVPHGAQTPVEVRCEALALDLVEGVLIGVSGRGCVVVEPR